MHGAGSSGVLELADRRKTGGANLRSSNAFVRGSTALANDVARGMVLAAAPDYVKTV
jgi:hypothetical protein